MKLTNMNEALPLTLSDYWQIALRRKWLIIGAIFLSLGIAGLFCLVTPKSYRSSTLILVEDQKMPQDYVKAIVGGNVEGRLIMIKQQVVSRTLLTQVIDEFKLFPKTANRASALEDLIETMRKNIRVETVGSPGTKGVEAFSISFAHEEPIMAMKITAKLASQFIDENLRFREQFVEGASEFLEQELAKAKEGLEVQEQAISDFRKRYMGELPQQMEANLRALDRIQSELVGTNEAIQSVSERIGLMEKAIQEYQEGTDPLIARLKELERGLASLSAGYKETYPDVIQTKQEIARIKADLIERQSLSGQDIDEGMAKYDVSLRGLLRQRDEARIDLVALKERRSRLKTQMKFYDERVERTPAREQDLMILIRDYDNMQRNYQSLLDKKLNARVAGNLEKRQKGEQFRMIDPAFVPQKPEKPDPFRIMLIGLALGCGVGFGGAFALEQMKSSFRRAEDAELLLGIPLLAAIPDFKTAYGGAGMALPAPVTPSHPQPGTAAALPLPKSMAGSQVHQNGKKKGWLLGRIKPVNGTNGASQGGGLAPELNLVSKWRPTSIVAEQFRVAATRLALMAEPGKNTVIVVTSAVKGEGKSACSVNLGYTLARDLGKTTLLIDCDFKNPCLHKYLGTVSEPGLAELLRGKHTPEDSIHPLEKWPLWLLPAGSQENSPIELSKIHQLSQILALLRRRFDYIILDAPPILPLADMNILAGMADILALVIRADSTEREVVQRAFNSLRPTSQAGILLTGVWTDGIPYYMVESRRHVHVSDDRALRVS
jgi:polysaccharide biosynthesis transport protein